MHESKGEALGNHLKRAHTDQVMKPKKTLPKSPLSEEQVETPKERASTVSESSKPKSKESKHEDEKNGHHPHLERAQTARVMERDS